MFDDAVIRDGASHRTKVILYNLAVIIGMSILYLLLDLWYVRSSRTDWLQLLCIIVSVPIQGAMPFLLFLANMPLFPTYRKPIRYVLIALIAIVISALFAIVGFIPFMEYHAWIGGQL